MLSYCTYSFLLMAAFCQGCASSDFNLIWDFLIFIELYFQTSDALKSTSYSWHHFILYPSNAGLHWDAINEGCGSSCYLQSGRVQQNPIRMTEISTIYQPHRQATPTPSSRPPAPPSLTPPPMASPGGGSRGCGNQQGRAFQIRQGSFKLNALRLPSTVSRFVIMQVIFSCVCATLGILSVAFRCWMAYLCIPVIVGAMVGGAFIDLF